MRLTLANGTRILSRRGRCIVALPGGPIVRARANADSAGSAEVLGYGGDVAAMTEAHDALHARLCDWLGLSTSYSLSMAAGLETDARLAALEEGAVMAVQRFARAAGVL